MKPSTKLPIHLTYCLNIHPGQTWSENFDAIKEKAIQVKRIVAPDESFALGLRLSAVAATELNTPQRIEEFKSFLKKNDLYVFTINGFPYGSFYTTEVKENAYHPDWSTVKRRDYTIILSDILASLLDENLNGSISTVPLSYGSPPLSQEKLNTMVYMLIDVAVHLDKIYRSSGKKICVGLEPEPDCIIENTKDTIDFFINTLLQRGTEYCIKQYGIDSTQTEKLIRRHIGVCFDTAHSAVQFENLADALRKLRDSQINICKVQLSSALRLKPSKSSLEQLKEFRDTVYLHQVKAKTRSGDIISYSDLPEALSAPEDEILCHEQWRVHFHVPLFFERNNELKSTSDLLDDDFFSELKHSTDHIEIETYTFNVLPTQMRNIEIVKSVSKEFQWSLLRLK